MEKWQIRPQLPQKPLNDDPLDLDIAKRVLSLQVVEVGHRRQNRVASCISFGKKYKCEKRASTIALYVVDVDKSSFDCFTSLFLYLMQNYAAFNR